MEISRIEYPGSPSSYECRIGRNHLVISTSFGPRILSLSVADGPNILFVDEGRRISRNDWYLFGGHRLWVAPETQATYSPDNDPCRVDIGDGRITVTAADQALKLEKSITVSERDGDFTVTHTVVNRGETLVAGALWALTCVVPIGTIFFPWGTGGAWDLKGIVYWHKWMGHTTNLNSPQFVPTDDLFLIHPDGSEGKVGTAGHGGFIGVTTEDYIFIKRFDRHPAAPYPDEGCAIQCYTCPDFVELETLSPLVTFYPGVAATHIEEWVVSNSPIDPKDGAAVRKLVSGR